MGPETVRICIQNAGFGEKATPWRPSAVLCVCLWFWGNEDCLLKPSLLAAPSLHLRHGNYIALLTRQLRNYQARSALGRQTSRSLGASAWGKNSASISAVSCF